MTLDERLQALEEMSEVCRCLILELESQGRHDIIDADRRWVAIGKTHLQQGLMALRRSLDPDPKNPW